MSHEIYCRARVAEDCLHEQPTERQWGEDAPMEDDGTYVAPTATEPGSIVCDPCWLMLLPLTPSGRGLLGELPAAIEAARSRSSRRSA